MRSTQKFPTPRGVVDGRIDADTYGPGFGVVRFSGIVDTVNHGLQHPDRRRDAATCASTSPCASSATTATTSTVGEAFVDEVCKQVQEDIPIWENKAYLPRPALADTDGPFMKFRKWASQFYAGEVAVDLPMYPAPAPDSPQPEPQGTTKQTASARIKGEEIVAR